MNGEFTPCEGCPFVEYQADEATPDSDAISTDTLVHAIEATGASRINAFQASAMSHMVLKYEAPEASADAVASSMKCARFVVYRGCERWKHDDEKGIVPRLAELEQPAE